MEMYNLRVRQENNKYDFMLPTGIYIGTLLMPADNAYILDAKVIEQISKVLAYRWGICQPQKRIK